MPLGCYRGLVTPDQARLSHAGGIWVTAGSDSFQSHNLCLKSDKVDQAKWDRTLLPPSLSQLIMCECVYVHGSIYVCVNISKSHKTELR